MTTKEEVQALAHRLGVMLTEGGGADFYDVAEGLSAGYAEGHAAIGHRVLLSRISALNELQSVSNNTINEYVKDARAESLSWTRIGDALDTSRQAAQQRYGD